MKVTPPLVGIEYRVAGTNWHGLVGRCVEVKTTSACYKALLDFGRGLRHWVEDYRLTKEAA